MESTHFIINGAVRNDKKDYIEKLFDIDMQSIEANEVQYFYKELSQGTFIGYDGNSWMCMVNEEML